MMVCPPDADIGFVNMRWQRSHQPAPLHFEMRRFWSPERSERRFAAPSSMTNFGFPLHSQVRTPGDGSAAATCAHEGHAHGFGIGSKFS
jgi:hypothetical protein